MATPIEALIDEIIQKACWEVSVAPGDGGGYEFDPFGDFRKWLTARLTTEMKPE